MVGHAGVLQELRSAAKLASVLACRATFQWLMGASGTFKRDARGNAMARSHGIDSSLGTGSRHNVTTG